MIAAVKKSFYSDVPDLAKKTVQLFGQTWKIAIATTIFQKIPFTMLPLDQRHPHAFWFFDKIFTPVHSTTKMGEKFFSEMPVRSREFFSLCLVGPIVEEVWFQGLFQKIFVPYVAKKLPSPVQPLLGHKWTRIVASSSLFALYHIPFWDQPFGPLFQFFLGFTISRIAEEHGLIAGTAFHSLWNFHAWSVIALDFYIRNG